MELFSGLGKRKKKELEKNFMGNGMFIIFLDCDDGFL